MRKHTETALRYTQFTPATHPALVALIDAAAQRPGLDPRNYDTWQSYRAEAASISRQWQTICQLLDAADYHQIEDAVIIDASQWAYSGRMTWDGQCWEYCCGQYFPVEYRAAVIAILRAVLPTA